MADSFGMTTHFVYRVEDYSFRCASFGMTIPFCQGGEEVAIRSCESPPLPIILRICPVIQSDSEEPSPDLRDELTEGNLPLPKPDNPIQIMLSTSVSMIYETPPAFNLAIRGFDLMNRGAVPPIIGEEECFQS